MSTFTGIAERIAGSPRRLRRQGSRSARFPRFGPESWLAAALLAVVALGAGCVRRTLSITTEPTHALVFLNDQEIGHSKATIDFLWYGDYDVVIRKDGYKTLQTHWKIDPPWYQIVPIDFFAEVLWPGRLHDLRSRHFVLEPQVIPTAEELLGRAAETRKRALDPRK